MSQYFTTVIHTFGFTLLSLCIQICLYSVLKIELIVLQKLNYILNIVMHNTYTVHISVPP